MKTPEQLKGTIRSMAAKRNLRAQEVLQMFLFERILERLANSKYKMNFILKGGLLISSMIGISERTTMDMDTTVRGIQMEEDDIVRIVKEILTVDVDDGILFDYESIEPIREEDAYPPLFCCVLQRRLQDSFSRTATIKFICIPKWQAKKLWQREIH